jgi:hypothetical protein
VSIVKILAQRLQLPSLHSVTFTPRHESLARMSAAYISTLTQDVRDRLGAQALLAEGPDLRAKRRAAIRHLRS